MEADGELLEILAEQRRELAAAQDLETDLEVAFRMQMQEAAKASLSLHPSSSSASPPTPEFEFPDDDVPDSASIARVLAEEIEKFEQESRDREQAEAEMRQIREDLKRRTYDRAFAREVQGVPEEEWRATGDHFQRPYGQGSSSSPSLAEIFRLYFKGLVSEETVGGAKKTVVGIGIAICDANDVLVFELKKPLVDGETSGEMVEVKALIEGLNLAVLLGLKRLTVFCDNNSLHQYVTGKRRPLQKNITTLVDQVTLLHRKFTHFNPSLVPPRDVKFAVKLAWDAIVTQITPPAEGRCDKHVVVTCIICLEDTDEGNMFLVDGCRHQYCFSCMKQYMEVTLRQGMLPKCPSETCKSHLKIESCKRLLTFELYNIMTQRAKEALIPATEKVYCPYPRCSALMSKTEVVKSVVGHGHTGPSTCTKCFGLFCIYCQVPWHRGISCFEYKKKNPYPCAEDEKLKSLATTKRWRQCVKCNHMVELAEGCYHIYCRCGFEFCYTCGAEWKNKKPTCACPIWDEHNIIYGERNRYPQRRRIE